MLENARRERFAQGVASGLNQSDAYRQANPHSILRGWKDETIWKRASEWMADRKVSGRVEELKEEAAMNALLTRQEWLQRMIEVSEGGEDQVSRLKALVEFGKAEGFYNPSKVDLLNSDGSMRPTIIQIVAKVS
jgi:uncharacterized protein YdiU (UPF0061 family)